MKRMGKTVPVENKGNRERIIRELQSACSDISKNADDIVGDISCCSEITITVSKTPNTVMNYTIKKLFRTKPNN